MHPLEFDSLILLHNPNDADFAKVGQQVTMMISITTAVHILSNYELGEVVNRALINCANTELSDNLLCTSTGACTSAADRSRVSRFARSAGNRIANPERSSDRRTQQK